MEVVMTEIPDDVLCTSDHLWVRPGNGHRVRLGFTSVLLDRWGAVESLSLPDDGEQVVCGDCCGDVEFSARTWEIVSPVTGEVVAVNPAIGSEEVEADPWGDGWLFDVRMSDPEQLDELLDPDEYLASMGEVPLE
ncbi:glycine cleavage system protein H [Cutibacterium sp. WCA-380-WT-3A]|uniref:Glycine cleavage system protein H n=1 Tax=Cutibacterium porci TaxID=2605781 RepID=A0A7K0J6L6_9ACTN|nr:glycine cleavage system protein H [Cutibacterium porci]MSS45572.1 glycine cleavage system protein H [Cutibacterium porci]